MYRVGRHFASCVLEVKMEHCDIRTDSSIFHDVLQLVRMEVASSRPDHLPTLSAAETSELSLLVKSNFLGLSRRCRQCYSDFLLQRAGDIEADHTDSGIFMGCADRNSETPHLGD